MEKVPFDPGIGQFAPCFSQDVQFAMQQVLVLKSAQQRKFKFQILSPQIFNSFQKIVAFYTGCLYWAYYIKNSDEGSEKEITGNNFLGVDVENNDKFDFLYEINFLIDYFEKYEKDVKFFLGKTVKLDEKWLETAKIYKEFLEINNNFFATKTTKDLKIPAKFEPKADLKEIKITFDKITNTGKLEEFFNL